MKTGAGQRAVARRIKPAVFPPEKHDHIWSPYDLDGAAVSTFSFLFLETEPRSQTQTMATESAWNNAAFSKNNDKM